MKKTHQERLLDYMREWGGVTSYEAFVELGITRLSAVIFELRHKGYTFRTEDESTLNRYGQPVHFLRYFLEEKDENN